MEAYSKLQPPGPTPADEICSCPGTPPIKLMCALSHNPIHCMNCNLEVPPERLSLNEELAKGVAFWRNAYDAIDRLWLESLEYELWAKQQLADISSPVNVRGRKVQRQLNKIRKCYYWYFQDEVAEQFQPISRCPICGRGFEPYDTGPFKQLLCESCMIVAVGE